MCNAKTNRRTGEGQGQALASEGSKSFDRENEVIDASTRLRLAV